MEILGIDEAGRGSVLGPLIVAGVLIPTKMKRVLQRMGVKDSKKLTFERRTILARKLRKMFDYEIVIISAQDIDNLRANGINLNEIETIAYQKVISKFKPEKTIVDAVDVNAERFQEKLRKGTDMNVIAEHKADNNYIEVSAASIIAKRTRDEFIEQLSKDFRKVGEIGSGYPSDPKTRKFLSNFTYENMPDCVRKSWKTISKIK